MESIEELPFLFSREGNKSFASFTRNKHQELSANTCNCPIIAIFSTAGYAVEQAYQSVHLLSSTQMAPLKPFAFRKGQRNMEIFL